MIAVYGLINAGNSSWGSPVTIGALAGSVAMVEAFVAVEARARTPLIPLRIFRHRNLLGATVGRFVQSMGAWGFFFLSTLYLEQVLGYSPLRTGLAILPCSAMTGVISLAFTPWLARRIAPKPLLVIGLVLLSAGLFTMSRVSVHSGFVTTVLPASLVFGLGGGVFFIPCISLAMSDVAPSEAGVASGLATVAQQLGTSIGVAALAAISESRTTHLLAEHEVYRSALSGGCSWSFLVAAGCEVLSALAAILILRSHHPTAPAEFRLKASAP